MEICITTGGGYGRTPLSAFDAALKDAGVYNFNLVTLSSIIPIGTTIKLKKYESNPQEYGYRLYVVKAEMRSRESGKYIGAAVGWVQLPDGRGVFVEHEEIGETKESVESNLTKEVKMSLSDLCKFRNFRTTEQDMKMKINVIKVTDSPASCLVLAVYKSEGWNN